MDERIESFLEQERPSANATTSFLKYFGNGNMQDGVREVYSCGEHQGEIKGAIRTIIGMAAMGVVIVGGCLYKKVITKGISTVKAYQKDKKKIKEAELKVQEDAMDGTDAPEENIIP